MNIFQLAAVAVAIYLVWPMIKDKVLPFLAKFKNNDTTFKVDSSSQVDKSDDVMNDEWMDLLHTYKVFRNKLNKAGFPSAVKELDEIYPLLQPNGAKANEQ